MYVFTLLTKAVHAMLGFNATYTMTNWTLEGFLI